MTKIIKCIFFIFFIQFSSVLLSTDTVKQDEYILIADNKGLENERDQVIKFFSYACSHCYALDPFIEIFKKNNNNINFKYVPAIFSDQMIPLAKLFFTLETMNLLPKLHESVYEVIHVDKKRIFTDKKIFEWAEENELINFVQFKKIYDSFDTNNKILYAKNLTIKSQITGTPYLMINGKYLTGPSLISKSNGGFSPARLEQVVKQLYKK
jgi:thiol:disulfide interchange protein DsbA